jgi:predicted transglutaminase-like cysteine proteinase
MLIDWPEAKPERVATLERVHQWAHSKFVYVKDYDRWNHDFSGNGDHWETDAELIDDLVGKGYVEGDCDAFAKMCWMALRRLEIDSRLVLCTVEDGSWHLVCECDGWILDNRSPVVTARETLEQLGYRWVSKSGFKPGGQWTTC